jgi:hypothetical protein
MIYLGYIDLLIYGTVLVLQIKNLHKYRDGNGQEGTRLLFIAQIIVLSTWTVSSVAYNNSVAFVCSFILAFNALAFYMEWNITKPLVRLLKNISK